MRATICYYHAVSDLHDPRPGAVLRYEGRAAVQRREPAACSQSAKSASGSLP